MLPRWVRSTNTTEACLPHLELSSVSTANSCTPRKKVRQIWWTVTVIWYVIDELVHSLYHSWTSKMISLWSLSTSEVRIISKQSFCLLGMLSEKTLTESKLSFWLSFSSLGCPQPESLLFLLLFFLPFYFLLLPYICLNARALFGFTHQRARVLFYSSWYIHASCHGWPIVNIQ